MAVLVIAHDNTDVYETSLKAARANEELVKSNTELAQFAYVASHDLQEPLRKIQTFAQRILELEHANLSATGKDYFNRMHIASQRMQQLIVDLISYSKTNTAEKYFEVMDLGTLLQNARESLKDVIEQKQAVIKSSVLPSLNVIPFQFEQLFVNIISNALKFSRRGVSPVITIGATKIKGDEIPRSGVDSKKTYYRLSVADNGIGFEPEFQERIFQVFQRRHGKQEYAGTGIGLSIVKKIIENHDGLITATSDTGKRRNLYHLYSSIKNHQRQSIKSLFMICLNECEKKCAGCIISTQVKNIQDEIIHKNSTSPRSAGKVLQEQLDKSGLAI